MPRIAKFREMSRDKRLSIYKLVGEGYTPREVTTIFNNANKGGSTASIKLEETMRIITLPEAQSFINKFRIDFLKTLKDIPVSEKKFRLHDMEKMRGQIMYLMGELNPQRKDDFTKYMTCTRRMIEILDLARTEMEYKPNLSIGIGLGNMGDFGELTDEQLKQQRDELIRKAGSLIERRSQTLDDDTEGDVGESPERSAEILLAASKELQRDAVQYGGHDVSDVRREAAHDPGLPAVRVPEQSS